MAQAHAKVEKPESGILAEDQLVVIRSSEEDRRITLAIPEARVLAEWVRGYDDLRSMKEDVDGAIDDARAQWASGRRDEPDGT